jgi:hypothetical protein
MTLPVDMARIASPFQQRMVARERSRAFLDDLPHLDYDLLLIDLIDERFHLLVLPDGAVVTLSSELQSSGFHASETPGWSVPNGSEAYFSRWEMGWALLWAQLQALGRAHDVRINAMYWSPHTEDGQDFAPKWPPEVITAANHFLSRLYQRLRQDVPAQQWITYPSGLLVGATTHRWGLAPFHYGRAVYQHACQQLLAANMPPSASVMAAAASPIATAQDNHTAAQAFCWEERALLAHQWLAPLQAQHLQADGRITSNETTHALEVFFSPTQGADVFQCRYRLPEPFLGNGVAACIHTYGWETLRYVALGYTHNDTFQHVKLVHVPMEQDVSLEIGHGDLAWGLQHQWQATADVALNDIRLYFKGTPGAQGATLRLSALACWQESPHPPTWQRLVTAPASVSEALCNVLHRYLKQCYPKATQQALQLMTEDVCPLDGNTTLTWPWHAATPQRLDTVGTFAYSWHALHPALFLLLAAREETDLAAQMAKVSTARDFVSQWIARSYCTPDPNIKFAWYDHGVAERQWTLLLLWAEGQRYGFDRRFMMRLYEVLFRQGQLLASPWFYASHQASRYHNHAWFQDLALLATALALPELPAAPRWHQTALHRLDDQLAHLIVEEDAYAVFVENSLGYHQGAMRLMDLATSLVALLPALDPPHPLQTSLARYTAGMHRFADAWQYPDGRAPSQGDTFRRANPTQPEMLRRGQPFLQPHALMLPQAGYGLAQGNHLGQTPFVLALFGSSLCTTHKHADDLSWTLFFDGIEWFIDPSFYMHEYHRPLPAYLRSAVAHNVLAWPSQPYALSPGRCRLEMSHPQTTPDAAEFYGEHRAYEESPDGGGLVITRRMRVRLDALALDVEDEARCPDPDACTPDLWLMFHCGEGVTADIHPGLVRLTHPLSSYALLLQLPGTAQRRVYTAPAEPGEDIAVEGGLTGLGFLQWGAIETLACPVPANVPLFWQLQAIPAVASPPAVLPGCGIDRSRPAAV